LASFLQAESSDSHTKEAYMTAERLADLFEAIDVNKDGNISYDEFRDGVQTDPFLIDVFFGASSPRPVLNSPRKRAKKV